MQQYPKLYLLLSSLVFFSCQFSNYTIHSSSKPTVITENQIRPLIKPSGEASKFKATIDVLNKHFSGLVIIKKTDSLTTHVVFITELGMKMFDLEKKDSLIQMVYVFEPMNQPALVSTLQTNFKNMLLLDVFGKTLEGGKTKKNEQAYRFKSGNQNRFFTVNNDGILSRQAVFHKRRRSSLVKYDYDTTRGNYSRIQSVQYGLVKIRIELNALTN